ncbi:MAG: glucose 1-dehydrogenase [Segniliparus sp.]|uniref:glucose 1-dehydrogenase n=1 Tax=Segniliparus sp. TaxID=2804064 RepID=UPI003F3EFBC4
MPRLAGKVVLISGAARGMGAAHARAVVAEGGKAVLGDIALPELAAVSAELGEAAAHLGLDVASPEDWRAAVDLAKDRFGALHVLVNNAGIANAGSVLDLDLDVWRKTLDVNLTGALLGIQAAAPAMIEAGGGSIVNVSSVLGLQGSPFTHAYVASKFGLRGLTKSTALELAQHRIRVNSVHPGHILTPMTADLQASPDRIPLRRAAEPAEVSALVVYLASDESSYSTGSEFVVDGGMLAGFPLPAG